MYKKNYNPFALNLQLFAEGGAGDGGTGAAEGATGETAVAAVQQTKGSKNPLADVKYGIQEDSAQTAPVQETAEVVETPDRKAEFKKLIKGEYKNEYDAEVQDIVQRRLKNTRETVEKYEALTPTLEMLAKKYGVDSADINALNRAIEEDDSYYEDEALEKGITVQQLKEIRKMERENSELRRQMQEKESRENANRLYQQWMEQAQQVKAVYPSFDLSTEMQNPKFIDLLRANIDVRTAYEVLNNDKIIPAAMQFTAKQVEQKLTNKIVANGARPSENGMSSQSASLTKSDVSQLTKEDRLEIRRRVAGGAKIRF